MHIRDFTKFFQINEDFLDTIDFIPFLKLYNRLGVMMGAIEKYYKNIDMPVELEGEVFKYYNDEDFKEYLEKRYKEYVDFYPIEDYLVDFRRE